MFPHGHQMAVGSLHITLSTKPCSEIQILPLETSFHKFKGTPALCMPFLGIIFRKRHMRTYGSSRSRLRRIIHISATDSLANLLKEESIPRNQNMSLSHIAGTHLRNPSHFNHHQWSKSKKTARLGIRNVLPTF